MTSKMTPAGAKKPTPRDQLEALMSKGQMIGIDKAVDESISAYKHQFKITGSFLKETKRMVYEKYQDRFKIEFGQTYILFNFIELLSAPPSPVHDAEEATAMSSATATTK
jgi:hypothetical protein